jgi:hypothetical protein
MELNLKTLTVAAATDNFTIIADSINTTNNLIQKQLPKCFEISDLGPINWLLEVSITWDTATHTFLLGQQAYIEQILGHFSLKNACTAAPQWR